MTEEPPKAFVVAYEYGSKLDHLTIPAEVLRRAEAELDAERERRRLAAVEAQAAIERERARKSWRSWFRGLFRRGPRP
jgi:hypothetical protein